MKKIIFTVCLLMAAMFLTAQDVPQAINFQAIARDANSEVMANTPIMIQLTILDGSPEGELVYREIRSLTTNAYGSFSFQIGRDPYMAVGEFADIDWAGGRKFLKIDYDPTATLSFNLSLGTVEFVSVPYAFAAGSVSYIDATGANDGDVLAYNAMTGRFEPIAMSGAGGGITVETDPTVPEWAKAESKPTYDYSEIENTPEIPTVPTAVSAFENDANYISTESQTIADVVSLGNSVNAQLKNVTDPTDAQDAVTKSYVDNLIAQLQEAMNNIGGGFSPFLCSEPTGSVGEYGYVDLGLPSGTLWATCNVGSTTPEGYGDYFAWGETSPKETYNWGTYRYCNGSSSTLTKYCDNADYGNNGFTDTLTVLEATDDAATANWGEGWRMPTQDELDELNNYCYVIWTNINGVKGRLFIGPNGNSIFLPAAGSNYADAPNGSGTNGHYWSSSLRTTSRAWYLDFSYGGCYMSISTRYDGRSIRAVCQSQN